MDGESAGDQRFRSVIDLKGKKVVVDKLTSHFGLNIWLFLRQEGLDADRGEVDLVELRGSAEERWKRVLSGDFAGTFVSHPHDIRAERAGGHVIRVCAMPMIRGVTLTTTMGFVKGHEAEIRDLIRGFVDAIHFFITRKQETLEILKEHATPILGLQSDEEVETLYEEWAHSLERKPYPSLEAIANVFQLAVKRDPEIASFNPLALWNTYYVRTIAAILVNFMNKKGGAFEAPPFLVSQVTFLMPIVDSVCRPSAATCVAQVVATARWQCSAQK